MESAFFDVDTEIIVPVFVVIGTAFALFQWLIDSRAKVGLVIGKGGETIKNIQARSGARVQVIPLHPPPGDTSTERTVQIDGSAEQIETAKQLVNEVISENRQRNSMGGGYPQQGYQARPPTSWGSRPPQMQQQSGYGYGQAGSYPGSQYGAPQSQYPGYPQQTGAGYPTSWDQSNTAPAQQAPQGSGYDYYNQTQQQQPAHSTDNSYYNYNQPPTSGYNSSHQSYPQDAYGGGYQTSAPSDGQAGQAQPPTQASPLGQQPGYGAPPTAQQGYGSQPPTQGDYATGYGAPPPQGHKPSPNPSAYGQTQLSPSQGYANPQAPPPTHTGYAQPPPASYGAASGQPGAYPGYGTSYGQQQSAYGGGSYGSGYSQAPVYASADGNGASNGAGAPPAGDPNVAAKAPAPESK